MVINFDFSTEKKKEMDPDSVKSTLSNLAFGNVMAAAARDYQKVLLLSSIFPQFALSEIDAL